MPSLRDVQAEFGRALRDPYLPAPAVLSAADRERRGFDVYRNNVTVSLVDALEETFPAVRRLVGDDYFRAAARDYVRVHPPSSPVLFEYGASFGRFLDDLPSASSYPYLGDVARLEWVRVQAQNAADAEPASIGVLADLDSDLVSEVALVLHPSVRLVASRWPVVSLWQAAHWPDDSARVDLSRPQDALVVRPRLEVRVIAMPPGGRRFLEAAGQGAPLLRAAQRAAAAADFDLPGMLETCFRLGAVAAVRFGEGAR